ncbi:MAG: cytochrome C [Chloroflexi bacterium]|nr:cytochrome C [Chloroflexota bacterium]
MNEAHQPSKKRRRLIPFLQRGQAAGIRQARRLRIPSRFTVDLTRPEHRRNLFLGFVALILVGFAFLFSGYEVYHYTESSEFCGTVCHPMVSQFARYQRSPHANVECAKCHIGPGASFFIKSKIDGLKQVYAVLANTYSRPIKSPVHDLRPARETCEECHTPTLFKDNIIKTILHYDNDEANTPVQSTLILKMGGYQESTGISQGIHWHITNPVYYIASDEQRQVILWVGVEQKDGTMKEYFARDVLLMAQTSFVEEARKKGLVREMDCIDCHNRTAHYIPTPEEMVDEAISTGRIPADLPYIRAKAVEVLKPLYSSLNEAYEAIDGLMDFYRVGYPAVYTNRRKDIESALAELKRIYAQTNFPEIGLNWQTNPNNERHTPFPGCFRCHDGKHVSTDESGKAIDTIAVKCNLCHTVPIVSRGSDLLVEAPVIVGPIPDSHSDFRWTVEHRSISPAQQAECYVCHGQAFCNNKACHNLSHPPDMLFTHADEYRRRGDQVCYTCHQNILCSRCHPGGIVENP